MKKHSSILLIVIFSLFLLWSRWIPHGANLSPVLALFLISGWLVRRDRWYVLSLPLLAFYLSDLYLGFYPGWIFTYISLVFVMFFGFFMKKNLVSFLTLGWGVALFFFIISNFGVWVTSGLYPLNGEGLLLCYKMALPFFRASLTGTTLFLAGFYFLGKTCEQTALPRNFLKNTNCTDCI